jgi:2-polyprenyl-3-methyl-5-hydroxy-6-metoxy-1,4-benzoquinol methylase
MNSRITKIYFSSLGVFIRKIVNSSRLLSIFIYKSWGIKKLRNQDASLWVDGTYHKTDVYKEIDDNARVLLDYVQNYVEKDESILDICCNQGRFLFDLQSHGYLNLNGFDVMSTAIDVIRQREEYNPEVMNIEHCLAQDFFIEKRNNEFDWAITFSATIELINPEFNIFKELSRTVKKGMILVINENGHAYPRFYRFLHKIYGFKIIETKTLDDKTLIFSKKIINIK